MPKQFPNLRLCEHPLAKHKLTLMRSSECSSNRFYRLMREMGMLLTYEVTYHFESVMRSVQMPAGVFEGPTLADKNPVLVPILRAGLALAEGMREMLPMARMGHLGIHWQKGEDLTKHDDPMAYSVILPALNDKEGRSRKFILIDPLIATGHTAQKAISTLEHVGVSTNDILFATVLVTPDGMEKIVLQNPTIPVYAISLEPQIDAHGMLVPGFGGDPGDRLFGTD